MSALETTMTYPSTPLLRRASAVFAVGAALAFGSVASAATILIDFGASSQTTNLSGWNNLSDGSLNASIGSLVASNGVATGITLTVTSKFNTSGNPQGNTNGTTAPTVYVASATQDSFYGNTGTFPATNGQTNIFPQLTLSGLDANTEYSFSFFASRMKPGSETTALKRTTDYTVSNGTDSQTVKLDATDNVGSIVSTLFFTASPSGTITIDLDPSADNNTTQKFTYLGVLEINTQAIPEPGTYAALAGLAILGFAGVRRRRA